MRKFVEQLDSIPGCFRSSTAPPAGLQAGRRIPAFAWLALRRSLVIFVLAFVASLSWALPEGKEVDAELLEPLPDDAYGNFKKCIWKSKIDETEVLSHDKIVFFMRNGDNFLVQLPMRCPNLRHRAKVGYISNGFRLCSKDSLSVAEERASPLQWSIIEFGPTCRMGKFEEISDEQYHAIRAQYLPPDAPSIFDLLRGRKKRSAPPASP